MIKPLLCPYFLLFHFIVSYRIQSKCFLRFDFSVVIKERQNKRILSSRPSRSHCYYKYFCRRRNEGRYFRRTSTIDFLTRLLHGKLRRTSSQTGSKLPLKKIDRFDDLRCVSCLCTCCVASCPRILSYIILLTWLFSLQH